MTKRTETKHISIKTLRHAKTGMLVAVSSDMKGLCVHGDTDDELFKRIPIAIQALLEASGAEVLNVVMVAPEPNLLPGYVPVSPDFDATVRFAA